MSVKKRHDVRCHGECGRFTSHETGFLDHGARSCPERDDAGTCTQACDPEYFCSASCANRFHAGGER